MPQASSEPNIGRALGLLRRRGLWIAVCFVLAGAAAFGVSKHQTKKYTATASLVFNNNELSQEIAGLSSVSTNLLIQQESNLELLHLGDMAAKTATILGRGLTEETVSKSIKIVGQTESSVAGVSATTTSPTIAAEIANTYAAQFVKEQQNTNRQYFQSALALVHKQLARLSPRERDGTAGVTLQDRAQSLGLLSELQPNTVEVAQVAAVPSRPSSPKTSRNTLIGAILGLFVGVCLALLLERVDPRTRGSEELEAIYRVPLLGVVPRSSSLSRSAADRRKGSPLDVSPAEAEAFHMIRARLRSFNRDRNIGIVLVSSVGQGEGKTTIATQLAAAAARMGSRVLLIEANLRRPWLAEQLGISSQAGLSDVLTGESTLGEAVVTVESHLAIAAGTRLGAFDLLPSGSSTPANPVELIESHTMEVLLSQARAGYDLVVMDAPELGAVSDAFLLLPKVDGVVIVGRAGRSRRDLAEHLSQLLVASGAPLVGVILNGVKATDRGRTALRSDYGDTNNSSVALSPSDGTPSEGEFVPTAKA